MENNILISVIVPVFRTEKYIHKCADSLMEQSYKNFEVIFVDDGSNDACPSICDDYCKKDERFKVIHKKNEGLGLTRNAGLQIIKGDYFTFLDSDDWLDPDHLRTLVHSTENGKYDVVIGGCRHCTETETISYSPRFLSGNISGKAIVDEIVLPIIAPGENNKNELALPMSVCFNLYKTSIMRENELRFLSERDTVGEDLFFNLDYFTQCDQVNSIEWWGYNYRVNNESISRKYNPERLNRTDKYYQLLKKKVSDLGLTALAGSRVERSALSKYRAALRLASTSKESFFLQYRECKRILESEVLQTILSAYPIKTYRPAIKMTSILMSHKRTFLTMILFKMEKLLKKK